MTLRTEMSSMGSRREEMELKSSISLKIMFHLVFSTKKLKNSRKNTKSLFFVFLSETCLNATVTEVKSSVVSLINTKNDGGTWRK